MSTSRAKQIKPGDLILVPTDAWIYPVGSDSDDDPVGYCAATATTSMVIQSLFDSHFKVFFYGQLVHIDYRDILALD